MEIKSLVKSAVKIAVTLIVLNALIGLAARLTGVNVKPFIDDPLGGFGGGGAAG